MKRVGVIGIGTMGAGMALNLLKAGFEVTVYNRTPERCQRVAEAGARVAPSVADLVREQDAVVLMLSDDAAVESVVNGDGGIARNGKRGLVVIDSSTILPATAQAMARTLAAAGIDYLDAPVTGSRPQAEAGKLFFLVGGPAPIYERCRPLFEAMGRRHIHLGDTGSGACAKLGNNFMGLINLLGYCEALTMVERFGIKPEQFASVINDSGGRSAFSEMKTDKMLRGDESADFAIRLAAKDLRLVGALARSVGHDPELIDRVSRAYADSTQQGGDRDVCAIYFDLRRKIMGE